MQNTNPAHLLQQLVRCPSVTPNEGGALSLLQKITKSMGFSVERPVFTDHETPDVENFYAKLGNSSPHLMFAGHTDVVPPGDETLWRYPAFSGLVVDGVLYGRGAVDMKGGIASFIAALARSVQNRTLKGSVSLLITGDEEGPAINGTVKLLQWAAAKGEKWDAALVGEPTCLEIPGDTIKTGRRGSLGGILRVNGRQGHVAYPHLADNPLPLLINLLQELLKLPLDNGNKNFQPSNLELTNIDSKNKAANVVPDMAEARFNIRFNDLWTPEKLMAEIEKRLNMSAEKIRKKRPGKESVNYTIAWQDEPSSAFLTHDNCLIDTIENAVFRITGKIPKNSTDGGTSDARFIKDYCPIVELGLVGKTMHKTDECVSIADLEKLTGIYQKFIEQFFIRYST